MATVIVDAGPIIAYLKRDDHDHAWAVETFRELRSPSIEISPFTANIVATEFR